MLLLCIERQKFVEDIERLTSEKADLLTRLKHCKEELKTAKECENCVMDVSYVLWDAIISVSIMREKAVSGMMAASRRTDTDVEVRKKATSPLKKVIRSQQLFVLIC